MLCCGLALLLGGCWKKEHRRLSASQIHSITQEFAAAAAAAAPRGAAVKIRQSAGSGDEVRISLPADSTSARSSEIKLLRSLGAVATRHRLTQDQPVRTGTELSILVRQAGVPTHVIEIDYLGAAARLKKPEDGSARLAIILDDLGADRASADAIFALGYRLTLSVLPGHEHSTEIAEEAHRRGLEVMLHLPMQASAEGQPEAKELRPGMGEAEVAATLDEFLQAVPDAAGVNNHQGSQATADPALMRELMPVLRERQLFYVDSRTTAATVAFDVAKDAGVPCAFRNVPFLDDVAQVAAVRRQLELAFRGAREKGEALAIGHPHAATLEALRALLPEAQQRGIQLVFASDVVH